MEWTRGRTIGRGSTATVSVATAAQSGHVFAVKSSELSHSESLRREQRILSTLSCPQVVAYEGCDLSSENGELLYNVFLEYAPAGTIIDVIRNHGGCLDETTVRSYTRGILLGLEFLHSSGIVHCDIKGQNVLVTAGGVKIADMGCARRVGDHDSWSVSGTPVYMAPEVARGEQQEFPADVWALGCTVIEMVTGRGPWPDVKDPVSAMYKIGFSSDVPEIPSNISKQGMDFLTKCLKRDPTERWSATKLLAHDFLKESEFPVKKIDDFCKLNTPNSVLDRHCLWDSMEESEKTIQIPCRKNKSLMDRIQQLGEDNFVLSLKMPNWEWDENWVTVRSNSRFEVEMLDSEQDINLVHEDESTSSCKDDMSEDYELVVDCCVAKISVKCASNDTSCSSAKCRYRSPIPLTECKNMDYILFIKLNFSNDKFSAMGKGKILVEPSFIYVTSSFA